MCTLYWPLALILSEVMVKGAAEWIREGQGWVKNVEKPTMAHDIQV